MRTALAFILVFIAAYIVEAGERSSSAIREFRKANPCPSNGLSKGPCPGYVIDHITPLSCAGADEPWNMQYQTTTAAKEKDRWERQECAR